MTTTRQSGGARLRVAGVDPARSALEVVRAAPGDEPEIGTRAETPLRDYLEAWARARSRDPTGTPRRDGKAAGIAVHTGARVASRAAASEVLVSSTVKDLVAGSGITFEDRGTHELHGVPGEWHLYAAEAPPMSRQLFVGKRRRLVSEGHKPV